MKTVVIFTVLIVLNLNFANFQQGKQVQRPERLWAERMRKGIARDKIGKTEWKQTEMVLYDKETTAEFSPMEFKTDLDMIQKQENTYTTVVKYIHNQMNYLVLC